MGKRKVMVVFGTRPEAIKMAPVIHALRALDEVETRVCVTGQHRDLLDRALHLTGIVPDIDLDLMQPGQTLDALTARLVTGIGAVLDAERPDRLLVHGDTLSALGASLAAHYRQIPIGHVEAGLRSGDLHQPWPEEGTRRMIACIADLHFAPTPGAAAALRAEGREAASIHVTGNTVVDALLMMRARLRERPALAGRVASLARRFAGRRIIAVTCHRRETIAHGLARIAAALRDIAARPDVALIFPVHPNPQIHMVMEAALADLPNVALVEPLDYSEFVALLDLCHLVLTDSGGVQEEAPSLGKPVLVLRETTERPEGIAAGTARLVGTQRARIVAETRALLDDADAYAAMARAHNPFGDGRAAARIADIIAREVAEEAPAPDRAIAG